MLQAVLRHRQYAQTNNFTARELQERSASTRVSTQPIHRLLKHAMATTIAEVRDSKMNSAVTTRVTARITNGSAEWTIRVMS